MWIHHRRLSSWLCLVISVVSLWCGSTEAAVTLGRSAAVQLLSIEAPADFTIVTAFIFISYTFQYLGLSGVFEMTNPRGYRSNLLNPQQAARRKRQVATEAKLGIQAMFYTVDVTCAWMFYGEPHTYFYGIVLSVVHYIISVRDEIGYFQHHDWNIFWGIGGIIAYIAGFDTWFYWSHRWLHDIDILWNKVHYVHHQFKEPSGFAQFAVHPIEAIIQGPVGHYMGALFFPIHPIQLAVLGFIGSCWAIAAHDGRQYDFNNHYDHHCKGRGRYIYFNLGYITPFWDRWCGTRWHEDHPKWMEWKTKRGTQLFDTRDGSQHSIGNDTFGAYAAKPLETSDVTGKYDPHANTNDATQRAQRQKGSSVVGQQPN